MASVQSDTAEREAAAVADEHLLQQVIARDAAALQQLYQRHGNAVYALAQYNHLAYICLNMQHLEIQELIPLYALGGLAADETARLAEHLDACSACRAQWNEYHCVADELLATVPIQAAPARIGVRLQNLVRNARRSVPDPRGLPNARFWNQPVALPRWAYAFAVIATFLLLGITGVLAWQMQQQNSAAQQVIQLLTARDLQFVKMATANGAPPTDKGFLCVTPENSAALLWLHSLAPLDQDRVYQVWLRYDNARDSGGIFRANADGRAVLLIQAPKPLSAYQEIGITIEPAAGSSGPTTPRVIGGKLN